MVKDKAYGWVRSDLSGDRIGRDQRLVQKLLSGMGYQVRNVFTEPSAEEFSVVVGMLSNSVCRAVAAPGVAHVEPRLERLREYVDVYVPDETGRTWARCYRRTTPLPPNAEPSVPGTSWEQLRQFSRRFVPLGDGSRIASDMTEVRDAVAAYLQQAQSEALR